MATYKVTITTADLEEYLYTIEASCWEIAEKKAILKFKHSNERKQIIEIRVKEVR